MIELSTYKVRDGMYVHLVGGAIHPPGTVLQLSPAQFEQHAHQLEEVVIEQKPTSTTRTRKAKTSEEE